jgi:hypothetical protein
MEHPYSGFIMQTAIEYNIGYNTARDYFNWYYANGTFYEKLEQLIAVHH